MYVQTKYYTFGIVMEKCDSVYCGCLHFSAGALSRVMTKMADEEFAVTGLSSSYAFLLMTVNSRPGITPSELSEQMLLTPSTITRLIEKMEAKQLVERKTVGRTTEVYPTDKSKALDADIKKAWRSLFDRYAKIIGEEESKRLTSEIYEAVKELEA